jgi:dipeptidyl aminopeptidase/acylaminoacyl peptidase
MMKKNGVFRILAGVTLVLLALFWPKNQSKTLQNEKVMPSPSTTPVITYPLQISEMRKASYPGSEIKIEQTLEDGAGYHQYVASYQSEGLKIYGLLTVPTGQKPASGWPVIIFNHGYIPPEQYRTTEKYVAYVDYFARNGYIVFKSDYRGHGSSEGNPEGGYYSPAYTIDVLNALASLKKYSDSDPQKIGMWGHSMGGAITLRSLVVDPSDIKVAIIWGGVVGTYEDLAYNWHRTGNFVPSPRQIQLRNNFRRNFEEKYGSPSASSLFWQSIDPNFYISDIKAPVQLDAGLADEEVPWQFSQGLDERLKAAGKTVEFYTYPDTDHNISGASFSIAMEHSLDFFNKYLKK